MSADGLAWLRSRRDNLPPFNETQQLVHAHVAREERHDLQHLALLEQIGEQLEYKSQHVNTRAVRRGAVRKAPGMTGISGQRSRGAIPWYVPNGAEWDLTEERSTRQFSFVHEKTWDRNDGYEELERYHRLADQLYVEECEDWDIAPLRGAARYPTSELDIAYLHPRRSHFREDEICE